MDELREVILAQLEELHGTGLSDERYHMYVDMVYQCETVEQLLELASLELQLEAHEFVTQLTEQMRELAAEEADDGADKDLLDRINSEGFGDSFQDDGFDLGFDEDEPADTAPVTLLENEEDIDPEILAMQKALLGEAEEDMSDPSYFDIDALLAKGSAPTQPLPSVEYNDSLAKLLAVYATEDTEDTEEDEVEAKVTAGGTPVITEGDDELDFADSSDLFAQPMNTTFPTPLAFGQPLSQGQQTKAGVFKQPPQGFGLPAGFHQPAGVGHVPPLPQGFGHPNKPFTQNKPAQPQVKQRAPQAPVQPKQPQTDAFSIFADFGKRKTPTK